MSAVADLGHDRSYGISRYCAANPYGIKITRDASIQVPKLMSARMSAHMPIHISAHVSHIYTYVHTQPLRPSGSLRHAAYNGDLEAVWRILKVRATNACVRKMRARARARIALRCAARCGALRCVALRCAALRATNA